MPIYEYQCGNCGALTEHLMRISDPDPAACPRCGGSDLVRQLSAPQFRLAGGGWYETDFKGDKDRKRNIAGEAGNRDAGGKADSNVPAAGTAFETKSPTGPERSSGD